MLTPRIQKRLDDAKANFLLRERTVIENRDHHEVIIAGLPLLNFCSNDYLNLSTHPDVIKAFMLGAEKFGVGSGSAPAICGYSKIHQELEETFAAFLQRDKAIIFNSGYHANLGVINTFADRNTYIVADKLCHASIIDGIILSRARYHRYDHQNTSHAEMLLQNSVAEEKILLTESVFSMEGNIADIKSLADIAIKQQALLIVDDAHAIGVLGKNGRGSIEHFQIANEEVPCLITPLGKAVASFGAIVSGEANLIDAILQFARTYRYSTALPAPICFATLAALKIIQSENWRREKLLELAQLFRKTAISRELNLVSKDATPIQSILIGDNQKTLRIQEKLMSHGFFVSAIRPPTVPANTARIRISLNVMQTEQQIIRLLDLIKEFADE